MIDTRILSDYEVNDIDDYLALIDAASCALYQNHNVVICCGAGISRSNAIALGVLMKHFHMDFYDAVDLIEEKVPICNIDPLHITVLKKMFNLILPYLIGFFNSNNAILQTLVFSFAAEVKEGGGSGDMYIIL